jgi:hypothetical protein
MAQRATNALQNLFVCVSAEAWNVCASNQFHSQSTAENQQYPKV